MHCHVPLHSGAVAEANVLPQVLTTMRGSILWKHSPDALDTSGNLAPGGPRGCMVWRAGQR
jgi:hypothetical protein